MQDDRMTDADDMPAFAAAVAAKCSEFGQSDLSAFVQANPQHPAMVALFRMNPVPHHRAGRWSPEYETLWWLKQQRIDDAGALLGFLAAVNAEHLDFDLARTAERPDLGPFGGGRDA